MKKTIYIVLLLIDVGLMGSLGYYIATKPTAPTPVAVVATSTEEIPSQPVAPSIVKVFPLSSGGKITVTETNPISASMSTLTITTEGFASGTPITLETNKVTNFFTADLNLDSFEELIIITTAQGSGSYGEATIFTTTNKQNFIPVTVPKITEEDTKKGGLFEGYMGHDSFSIVNGSLIREFPMYNATDTNSNPTGATKQLFYVLNEKDGVYTASITKAPTPSATKSMSLASTSWTWISATQGGVTSDAPEGNKFVLTFSKDMKVVSSTDCNTLSGSATVSKDSLKFSALAMTMMYCEGSKEKIYADLLTKTKSFLIEDGNTLTLILSDKNTLTFRKK